MSWSGAGTRTKYRAHSKAALEKHLAQPHMEDLRRLKGEYALDTKLERYE